MDKIVYNNKSSHWYEKDGTPRYEVPSADGKKMVKTTVAHARKMGLLPSVTTILNILAKPQLESWKIEQAILCALTLPRLDDESEINYAKRIAKDAQETSLQAMAKGIIIHNWIECFMLNKPFEDDIPEATKDAIKKWIDDNIDLSKPYIVEKNLASVEIGCAGRTDLICYLKDGRKAMLDWKSKGTKEEYQHRISFYDDECWQLSAYKLIEPVECLINVGISTMKDGVIDSREWTNEEVEKGQRIFKNTLSIFRDIKEL